MKINASGFSLTTNKFITGGCVLSFYRPNERGELELCHYINPKGNIVDALVNGDGDIVKLIMNEEPFYLVKEDSFDVTIEE